MSESFDQNQLAKIAEKILQGTETAQERSYFDRWYHHFKDDTLIIPKNYIVQNKRALREKIWAGLQAKLRKSPQSFWRIISFRYALAAALTIFLCFAGIYTYRSAEKNNTESPEIIQREIFAAKQGATLTLSDGSTLSLGERPRGTIAADAGYNILLENKQKLVYKAEQLSGNNSLKVNTLSTGKGQTYQLILPDGTQVWLNAQSSIKFHTAYLAQGQREVELTGEAYFEVAPDKHHPFLVRTNRQLIKVVGTKFNVRAYSNTPLQKTSLLEGQVNVATNNNPSFQAVKAGQSAIFDGKLLRVLQTDLLADLAWKNGDFCFQGGDFLTLIQELERWYNVDFIVDPSIAEPIDIMGRFSRRKHLFSILNILETTTGLQFIPQGDKIIVRTKSDA